MARSGTSAWGVYFANPTEVLVVLSWGDIGFQESDSQDAAFSREMSIGPILRRRKAPHPAVSVGLAQSWISCLDAFALAAQAQSQSACGSERRVACLRVSILALHFTQKNIVPQR